MRWTWRASLTLPTERAMQSFCTWLERLHSPDEVCDTIALHLTWVPSLSRRNVRCSSMKHDLDCPVYTSDGTSDAIAMHLIWPDLFPLLSECAIQSFCSCPTAGYCGGSRSCKGARCSKCTAVLNILQQRSLLFRSHVSLCSSWYAPALPYHSGISAQLCKSTYFLQCWSPW